ncbi:hypothetical protein [Vreelandella olivaria]|uniref:hypothetical protein n=1 Tax=Vreelandella olivaria TaxID=390919 RepID=UPI00201EF601|nr:hypothetical protein [Halomonas olivaria]
MGIVWKIVAALVGGLKKDFRKIAVCIALASLALGQSSLVLAEGGNEVEEAFNASISEMLDGMSESEAIAFQQGLASLMLSKVMGERSFIEFGNMSESEIEIAQNEAMSEILEMTASEIMGSAININDQEPERNNDILSASLDGFIVQEAVFYFREGMYGKNPVIELTVTNRTGHAVSRAYFEGVLKSPGRSVPWVRESFNYTIPGGIEPGETLTWTLSPNSFGPWANPSIPEDAELSVTTVRLDDADGDSIVSQEE